MKVAGWVPPPLCTGAASWASAAVARVPTRMAAKRVKEVKSVKWGQRKGAVLAEMAVARWRMRDRGVFRFIFSFFGFRYLISVLTLLRRQKNRVSVRS